MKSRFRLFLIILFVGLTYSWAGAQDIPEPKKYVEDHANIIDDATEHKLNGYLQELEQKTTAQVIVLTVDTTGGVPIEEFSINLAERWKLGQKGKDNGVLITVAKNDKKARTEVGYGLEGILPDGFCGTIERRYAIPNFRKGNFSQGIYQWTLAIINKIADSEGVKITGMPKVSYKNGYGGCGAIGLPLMLVLFIVFFRFGWIFLPFLFFPHRRGYFRSWGGGSSFGGFGGFGSFGGGGGGSFGGGGSSFSW